MKAMLDPQYDRYHQFLGRVLTPARLKHSFGVMQVMGELAEIYHLETHQARAAGLLHDAAKDLSQNQIDQIIQEGQIEIQYDSDLDYVLYLHGPVGAYFVERELGVEDALILDAIRNHTFYGSGPNFESAFQWCLRFADVLEPGRNWKPEKLGRGVERLREIVYAGRLEEGAFFETGWLIQLLGGQDRPVHPNIRRIHQELGDKLGLDERFLTSSIY